MGLKLKVGIVTSWFERGAAYVSRQYMDALRPGHEVLVYSRGGEKDGRGNPEWDQPFVTWGKPPLVDDPSAVDLDDFARWVKTNAIDCVFFNEQRSWPAVTWCARNRVLNGAYVVHYREDTVPYFDAHDFLICNARHHQEVFESHARSIFLPWGTDLQRFHPSSKSPVEPGYVTFFHSAGMNAYRKGTDLVLAAFAKLEGPARLLLHSQDKVPYAIPDRVTLIDRTVPDLAELYRLGDVCVYPTRHEGLGLTIAESLASGLPIIVTDQAPVNEHADEETVRTAAVRVRTSRSDGDYWPRAEASVVSLQESMQRFVNERERIPELQQKARAKAKACVDWNRNAGDLPGLFSSFRIIDNPRKWKAVSAAEEYEHHKFSTGLRNWIGHRLPAAVRLSRRWRG